MRLSDSLIFALCAPLLLAGCTGGGSPVQSASAVADNGPHDDYPVVLGDPFTIDGVTYTPEDVMNYDAVGFAVSGNVEGAGVVAAHKTLPLPSYVELTNLDTGRTILARLTSRGPMRGDALVDLSAAAAIELGTAGQLRIPVRVRRVNPPEAERSMLRAGEPVPARMDTPVALLAALKRKLGGQTGGPAQDVQLPVTRDAPSAAIDPRLAAKVPDAAAPPPEKAAPTTAKGTFVQLGAFASEANARKAANSVAGQVSKAGKYWVARMGPFASKTDIDAALAKARAAGYGEAMVRRVN